MFTCPFVHLFFAGRKTEICGRASYIMNITFKIWFFCQQLCLFYQRFMAPSLNNPSLMKGQSTKTTCPKASPIANKAELNFSNSRNSSFFFINWMIISHIRQVIDLVHLALRQRLSRRILHNIDSSLIRLYQSFSCKRVCIGILDKKAFGIVPFILQKLLVIGQKLKVIDRFQSFCLIYSPFNKCNVFHIKPTV